MKRYLRIYIVLLRHNFSTLIAYRTNFINSLIAGLIWGIFSTCTMLLLTSKNPTVYGWNRNELLVLVGMYNIIIGLFHIIFSSNFQRFSRIITYGELDSLLLKPVDSQFLISFWLFRYAVIPRLLFAVVFTGYMLHSIGREITAISFLTALGTIIVGILLLYSVWFILSTLLIWYNRLSNLTDLLYEINGVSRYPQEIYREVAFFIFLFLFPITLVVNTPARILLHKNYTESTIALVLFSFSLFFLSRKFWKFALRFYTSASS